MKKTIILLSFLGFLVCCGCVSKSRYGGMQRQLEQSTISQARLRQENERLNAEIKSLEYRNEYMNSVVEGYEERINTLEKYIRSSKKIQNKIITEISVVRQSLRDKLKIKDLELEALREQNFKLINWLENQQPDKK